MDFVLIKENFGKKNEEEEEGKFKIEGSMLKFIVKIKIQLYLG